MLCLILLVGIFQLSHQLLWKEIVMTTYKGHGKMAALFFALGCERYFSVYGMEHILVDVATRVWNWQGAM